MSATARILGNLLGLPPVRTPAICVLRAVEIPMADGQRLHADRYVPTADQRAPLILIRTPYPRRPMAFMARTLAERGYQVLVVNVRGTDGSGGRFRGWTLEPADGPALMAWLREQPWFSGAMATWGASFTGYTQWALATEPIPEWKAAVIQDAPSEVRATFLYRGGALALHDWLGWAQDMHAMGRSTGHRGPTAVGQLLRMLPATRRLRRATAHLPVTDADRVAAGEHIDYVQQWLRHPSAGEFWSDTDHSANAVNMPPVVHIAGGWQDIFLPGTLADHAALLGPGREVRLLVGPWTHGRGSLAPAYMREAFSVVEYALRGRGELPPVPVRLNATGVGEWRNVDRWPPAGYAPRPWFLQAGGSLAPQRPGDQPPSRYRYDPARPTPSIGGPVLKGRAGPRNNRRLENRPDVLTFTTPALTADLEVVGPVTAEIHIRSTRVHTDVVARLCDVAPNGRSTNVCDGILRLTDDTAAGRDGARAAWVELWPTAHRFRRGHRVRLQVASGAHPRFQRNLGTGDQLGTRMLAADQEILHDPAHPSAVYLPVATAQPREDA